MKVLIREIAPHQNLYRDDKTGIAWIEDGSTGLGHSCHPNISATGSISGMKALGYWGKKDRIVRSHGFYYNTSVIATSSGLDQIAEQECRCVTCMVRRNGAVV